MGYDLHLFRPSAGGDFKPQPETYVLENHEDIVPGPIDPAAEEHKQKILQALRSTNARLEQFIFDHEKIARLSQINVDEARRRYRHIELDSPEEDGTGVQLMLWDNSASLSLPYRHSGEAAQRVWMEIWNYLRVVERVGGHRTYDPQLDRTLDLESQRDFQAVLNAYAPSASVIAEHQAELEVLTRKPW